MRKCEWDDSSFSTTITAGVGYFAKTKILTSSFDGSIFHLHAKATS
jgi:hypothetical protein